MENEDDHNYTDVMTGYWNTVGSTIILVATMGSSSVVTEGASTAGGVVSKASLAIDAGSTSIHCCARTTSTRQRTPMSRQPLTGRAFARKFLRRTMAATMSGTSSTGTSSTASGQM